MSSSQLNKTSVTDPPYYLQVLKGEQHTYEHIHTFFKSLSQNMHFLFENRKKIFDDTEFSLCENNNKFFSRIRI